jgi:hypothetical protein
MRSSLNYLDHFLPIFIHSIFKSTIEFVGREYRSHKFNGEFENMKYKDG